MNCNDFWLSQAGGRVGEEVKPCRDTCTGAAQAPCGQILGASQVKKLLREENCNGNSGSHTKTDILI